MNDISILQTSLPVDDPKSLLKALQGAVDQKDLLRVDSTSSSSVHAHVLTWFLTASSDKVARLLGKCCLRLIALQAPLTDGYGNGAASQFCGYPWPTAPDQVNDVAELADKYRDAGWWDIERPLDGNALTRKERDAQSLLDAENFNGLKPLAAAIFGGNSSLARYLCDRGASLELGVAFAGEPPIHAVDLALEEGEGEIHGILVEATMRRRLVSSAPSVAHLPSAAGPISRRNRRPQL